MSKKQNILITGGAGYIGSHIVELLIKNKANIIVIDNLVTGHKKLLNKNILSLIKNIRKVLRKAIKQGGSSVKNFNNTKGQKGKFQEFLCVYGREGKSCIRSKCPGKIKAIRISNRSTFYCSICQK